MGEPVGGEAKAKRRSRRMVAAVNRELRAWPDEVNATALAEIALALARAIDSQTLSNNELVKAADSLRVTMNQLREVARQYGIGDDGEDGDRGAPLWNAEDA